MLCNRTKLADHYLKINYMKGKQVGLQDSLSKTDTKEPNENNL